MSQIDPLRLFAYWVPNVSGGLVVGKIEQRTHWDIVNAFVIARDSEGEARAVLADIIDKADPEAVDAFGHAAKQAGAASPEGEGTWAKSRFEDLTQYDDGFKTNLIGRHSRSPNASSRSRR